MAKAPLPQLPRYAGNDPQVKMWADQLCRTLEAWSVAAVGPTGESWAVSGTTPARAIDHTSITTVAQVVDVLGTLAQDLSNGGPPLVM